MKQQQAYNEESLFSYLLGELSEEEAERIERHYLADEEFFDRLLAAEDELIDKYARRHGLSDLQRARFEDYFLRSPGRHERVGFAQAWAIFAARNSRSAGKEARSNALAGLRPFRRGLFWAPLAVAAMLLVFGSLSLIELARLRNELEKVDAKYAAVELSQQELQRRVEEQNEKLAQQLNEPSQPDDQDPSNANHQQTAPALASLILTPGMVRGSGDAKTLVIPSKASRVSLEIHFRQGEYDSYQTILKTVDGDEVARRSGLRTKPAKAGKAVVWKLPADRFNEGDYVLSLNGVSRTGEMEDLASYSFAVVKR